MAISRHEAVPRAAEREPTASSVAARQGARWRAARVTSWTLVPLALLASLAGLLVEDLYTGPASVEEMLRGYDLVTLTLAAPALALSMLWAGQGAVRAHLVWVGVLAYFVYTYALYVFGTPFNDAFLMHTAVFGVSVFALVLAVSALDVVGIAERLAERTPRRLISGILGLLAVGLGGMWIYYSAHNAVTADLPPGSALVEPEIIVHLGIVLDLALLVPAYVLAAVLLWRGAGWGYVMSALVLVSGTLHQISYMVALLFQAAADVPGAVAFDPFEPVIALLFALATALLLRGAGRTGRRAVTRRRSGTAMR